MEPVWPERIRKDADAIWNSRDGKRLWDYFGRDIQEIHSTWIRKTEEFVGNRTTKSNLEVEYYQYVHRHHKFVKAMRERKRREEKLAETLQKYVMMFDAEEICPWTLSCLAKEEEGASAVFELLRHQLGRSYGGN